MYSDLFVLIGEALLKVAEESESSMSRDILDDIVNFWNKGAEIVVSQEVDTAFVDIGISAEVPAVLSGVPFPVIYTFTIGLFYDTIFAEYL